MSGVKIFGSAIFRHFPYENSKVNLKSKCRSQELKIFSNDFKVFGFKNGLVSQKAQVDPKV